MKSVYPFPRPSLLLEDWPVFLLRLADCSPRLDNRQRRCGKAFADRAELVRIGGFEVVRIRLKVARGEYGTISACALARWPDGERSPICWRDELAGGIGEIDADHGASRSWEHGDPPGVTEHAAGCLLDS